MRSKTEGAGRVADGCVDVVPLGDARGVFADGGVEIGVEAREGEEAAGHSEQCVRAWAAIVWRGFEVGVDVVEVDLLAREELGCAVGEDAVAIPFAVAEAGEVVAPVGVELRCSADAFEAGDVLELTGDPGDELA